MHVSYVCVQHHPHLTQKNKAKVKVSSLSVQTVVCTELGYQTITHVVLHIMFKYKSFYTASIP